MKKLAACILVVFVVLGMGMSAQAAPEDAAPAADESGKATSTATRPLNEAEKRIVSAFRVFKTDGSYEAVNVRFSDEIENGSLVFALDKLGEEGYMHCSTRIDAEKGRVEYAWSRGAGDYGKGVGLVNDNAWIAEVSAGTESALLTFLKDGSFVGARRLTVAEATAIMDAGHERLFSELLAVVSGQSAPEYSYNALVDIEAAALADGVEATVSMKSPKITFWTNPSSAEYKALEPVERISFADIDAGTQRALTKIRFRATVSCKAELAYGVWKKNGYGLGFEQEKLLFSHDIEAGRIYEFTAPIFRRTEESSYFFRFLNSTDESTAEWYLQDEGYGGRAGQDVFSVEFAFG